MYVYKGNIMTTSDIFYLTPFILSLIFCTVQCVAVYNYAIVLTRQNIMM